MSSTNTEKHEWEKWNQKRQMVIVLVARLREADWAYQYADSMKEYEQGRESIELANRAYRGLCRENKRLADDIWEALCPNPGLWKN